MDQAALGVHEATPAGRDRVVDLVRAIAIVAVVIGHWIAAVATHDESGFGGANALESVPLLQPLTWLLQVMPLVFVVAGFSGAASWPAAAGRSAWSGWLHGRLLRIWRPASVFVGVWMMIALAASALGHGAVVADAGHLAMIQLWFLPVYLLSTALIPVLVAADRRWGWRPLAATVATVALVDVLGLGLGYVGLVNLVVVWLAFVQIGIRWQHGHLQSAHGPLLLVGAIGALVGATSIGPYPVAMVGIPGGVESNVTPPNIALLMLGLAQTGLVLALHRPLTRWLHRPRPWMMVVAINRRAMTLYLWHLTAAVIAAVVLLPLGLPQPDPGSAGWWLLRPIWLLGCAIALAVLVSRFGSAEDDTSKPPAPRACRVGAATVLLIAAFLRLTLHGPAGELCGLDAAAFVMLAAAATIARLTPPGGRKPPVLVH